jgi:RNA polymerase sigma-70 factor (ECF subfamily)
MQVVRNDEIAKDLWQDAYLKAWRSIRGLRDPSKFRGWLLTIVRNLALDWLRQNRRRKTDSLEESGGNASDPIDDEADSEVLIEREYVRCVLAKMNPVYRIVLLLKEEGYSAAEIAQQLGYTEGTVTTYWAQARKQFRQLYHAMGNTENASGRDDAQTHNASMPKSPDANDHAQGSQSQNENRKEI